MKYKNANNEKLRRWRESKRRSSWLKRQRELCAKRAKTIKVLTKPVDMEKLRPNSDGVLHDE